MWRKMTHFWRKTRTRPSTRLSKITSQRCFNWHWCSAIYGTSGHSAALSPLDTACCVLQVFGRYREAPHKREERLHHILVYANKWLLIASSQLIIFHKPDLRLCINFVRLWITHLEKQKLILLTLSHRVIVLRTEEDAKRMASLHATESKEIMFTTYSFTHNGQYSYDARNQAKHVWESLRQIDRLKNAVIISYDTHSCQVMWENGIPCFLDHYMPQPDELPGRLCKWSV